MNDTNVDKEKVIVIVNRLLERSGLSIDQVVARMQSAGIDLSRSIFENRFTTRIQQKPNITPESLIALIAAFTQRLKPDERCTAQEALGLASIARFPFEQLQDLRQFFPETEFATAFEQIILPIFDGTNRLYEISAFAGRNGLAQADALTKDEWGEAPDVGQFCGRETELSKLDSWVRADRCRLITILGMGGIGKTTLTKKLAEEVRADFDYLFWKSLRNAPPIDEVVDESLRFLFGDQEVEPRFNVSQRISLLVRRLRKRRCLIIIDGAEAILNEGISGNYLVGYEEYQEFFQQISEVSHNSCLLLTSREKPDGIALFENPTSAVRTIRLQGITVETARQILDGKNLSGNDETWQQFVNGYSGNPMALKLASEPIDEVYNGNIDAFLKGATPIFTGVRDLLDAHLSRLSTVLERPILYWLAIEREAVSPDVLHANFLGGASESDLLEALGSLRRRSLVEKTSSGLTQQNVIMEYMTERFVELISNEIEMEMNFMLSDFPIMKVQTKEYIRNSQNRLILKPIVERLLLKMSKKELIDQLFLMLRRLQQEDFQHPSYAAGNIVNLLTYLGADLRNRNFAGLIIRQADLRGIQLQDVDLSGANCSDTLFSQTFGSITSVDFSPDGTLVAGGIANGNVRVWEVQDQRQLMNFTGHTDLVWSVAFSPDGKILASSSQDQTVRLWNVNSGECIAILSGHSGWVKDLAFSNSDTWLASCSNDGTVCIWDYELGEMLTKVEAHNGWIWSIAFSPDDRILASAGQDGLIKLWDTDTEECIQSTVGHSGPIRSISFSPNGQMLATASFDHAVRLWYLNDDSFFIHQHKTLARHENLVWSVTFSPDSMICASAGDDQCIRLWRTDTGELIRTLHGHNNRVWAAAFSPDGRLLVSGSDDQTLRFWDVATGRSMHILEGYSNQIWTVDYHIGRELLAAGGDNNQIYLWGGSSSLDSQKLSTKEADKLRPCTVLTGHSDRVRSVVFSSDSSLLVSGGDDQTVRVWNVEAGTQTAALQGHISRIWSVAISPDNKIIASGSEDNTIRLWRTQSGRCFRIIETEQRVWSVAFSPADQLLASASDDHDVRLWNLKSGKHDVSLHGHTGRVWSVAFSPDGQHIASASDDQTVRIWNVKSGNCLKIFAGHTALVWSVSYSRNGKYLISGSDDRTVRLWNIESGKCKKIFQSHEGSVLTTAFGEDGTFFSGGSDQVIRQWHTSSEKAVRKLCADRPYERMNISEIKGLSPVQIYTLKVLGAIEK